MYVRVEIQLNPMLESERISTAYIARDTRNWFSGDAMIAVH